MNSKLGNKMRLLLILILSISSLQSVLACSLEVTTETLFGASAGTVCTKISEIMSDRRGPYRVLDYDVRSSDGELEEFPEVMKLRERMTRPLRRVEILGLGTVSLMTLKVNSMDSATVKFLNGNSITVEIDDNGRVNPSKICVKQVGLNQLRGFAEQCP